jgi:hypothetical protein
LVGQISLFIHLLSDYLIFCCCYFHLYLINSTTVSFSLAFVIHPLSDHPISYSAVICILYLINSYTFSFNFPAWSRGQTFRVAILKFMGFLTLSLSLLFLIDKHLSSDDSSCITMSLQLDSSGISPVADDSLNCFSYYSLYKIWFS